MTSHIKKPPQIITTVSIEQNLPTNEKIIKKYRSYSVDNKKIINSSLQYQQKLSLSCSIIDSKNDFVLKTSKLSLKPIHTTSLSLSVTGHLLKLPNNSQSKQSLNCLITPAGSFYDVSDTNSMVFKHNDFDDEENGDNNNGVSTTFIKIKIIAIR
jgi:hypothetical protein